MTDISASPLPIAPATCWHWLPPLAGLILAGAASYTSLASAGLLQGVLFASILIVVLLVPAMTAAQARPISAIVSSVAVGLAALVGPLVSLREGTLNSRVFLPVAAVIITLAIAASAMTGIVLILSMGRWRAIVASALASAIALAVSSWALEMNWFTKPPLFTAMVVAGLTAGLLHLASRHPLIAAFIVSVSMLSWLAWPIVLSPWLAGRENWVAVLAPAHPLLAIDAALTGENATPWTEHRLMYSQLTVLQQHVMSKPPQSVGTAIALNLAVTLWGLSTLAIDSLVRSHTQRQYSPSHPQCVRKSTKLGSFPAGNRD